MSGQEGSDFLIRPRLVGLGLDQLLLAKLVQHLLLEKNTVVDFMLVPTAFVGTEYVDFAGIDFRVEPPMEAKALRALLQELSAQSLLEGPKFSDLRVGSTSEIRKTLEQDFRKLCFTGHRAAAEWNTLGNYGGPQCALFDLEAAEFLGVLDDVIRRRLQRREGLEERQVA